MMSREAYYILQIIVQQICYKYYVFMNHNNIPKYIQMNDCVLSRQRTLVNILWLHNPH